MRAELSAAQARRLALRAEGLYGAELRRAGPGGLLPGLGSVQLDTIAVLARSHQLVAQSRLGPVPRERIEAAYWSRPARAFEYWSHAACLLPLAAWPWFGFRRRQRAADAGKRKWPPLADGPTLDRVLALIAERGPSSVRDLGPSRRRGEWWDWSPLKVAAEQLLGEGRLTVTERRGWERLYELPERAIPAALRERELDDRECLLALVANAGGRLGVATETDLAEVHRLSRKQVAAAVPESGLVAVAVQGWPEPAWADPRALDDADRRGRHRTTLLSPFDSLLWSRERVRRLFGFDHKIEAYVPAPKRRHGYFAMPLLHRGRLLGRIDPARDGDTLVARRVSLVDAGEAPQAAAIALREAAAWVGCTALAVERVAPARLGRELGRLLRQLG